MQNFKNIIISIFLALVGALLIGIFVIIILMLIIPSQDKQGHVVMPLFQFAMGWLIGIIAFFIIFIFTFRKIRHREIHLKIGNRPILILYLILSLLFVFDVIISFYGYSFSGYYVDKIISWLWLSFTVIIIVKFWKKKSARIYFYSLLTLVGLSILPMLIPFFGIVYYFSTLGNEQKFTIIHNKYRLEIGKPNVMAKKSMIVYEEKGILEKIIVSPKCSFQENMVTKTIDDVRFVKLTKSEITLDLIIEGKDNIFTYPLCEK